jgi:hypothetical protein
MSNPISTRSSKSWLPAEDQQLLHLRNYARKPWAEIATLLSRSVSACKQHYILLKKATTVSSFDWDDSDDDAIIDGMRQGLRIEAIALELDMDPNAVKDRWQYLQRQHLVQDDVLAVRRCKEELVWSTEEDEFILKMYIEMKTDEQIMDAANFKGKSRKDVKARRVHLVYGGGRGTYLRMLGIAKDKTQVKTGLEKAMGKPEYDWTM